MKKLSFLFTTVAVLALFGFGVRDVHANCFDLGIAETDIQIFGSASLDVTQNNVTINVNGNLSGEEAGPTGGQCEQEQNGPAPYCSWYTFAVNTSPSGNISITSGTLSGQLIPVAITSPAVQGTGCFDPGGDANFAGSRTFDVSSLGNGIYTVTLSVTDTHSQTDTVNVSFTISNRTNLLTVSKAGTGSGTVTSVPSGINCGSDCSENYTNGTSVTLSQSAAAGSTFAGWSGACSGTGSCSVSMTQARSVTATFNTSSSAPTCLGPTSLGVSTDGTFSASGGTGSYSWSTSPSGSPASAASGSSFTTQWGSTGSKTVTVTSGGLTGTCSVNVSTTAQCNSITVTSNAPTNWLIGGPQTNGQNIPSPGYPAYVTSGTATTDSSGNPLPIGSYGGPLGSGFHADLTPDGWYGPTLSPNSAQMCNTGGSISWTLTYKKDGACGSANGQTFSTAPTTNLCSAGTASSVTSNPTTWTWTCAGISGGTTASCSANKPAGEQVTVDMAVRLAGINPYGDSVTLPAGGGSVDIRWLTTGSPTSCTASASPTLAAWSGSKGVLETNVQTGIANGTSMRTYSISCTNGSSTATDSVVVYVGAPVLPTVTLSANPNPVSYGQPTTLTWSSTNATSCSVTQGAGFDTGGAIFGSDQSSNIYASPETFGVSCTGPGGSASATAVVKLKPECLPAGQTVGVGQQASLTARGGNPYPTGTSYAWTSTGGTPTSGTGSAYAVSYATEGVKSVTVASDGMTSTACTVTVTTTPPTTGTVVVTSNLPTTWAIAGPKGTQSQSTPSSGVTYTEQPEGSYTLSSVPDIEGYTKQIAPNDTQWLSAGETKTFTITYTSTTEPPPPGGGDGPYVDLQVNGGSNAQIPIDGSANLSWETSLVVEGSCEATDGSGVWTGTKSESGIEIYEPDTEGGPFTLTLTCLDEKGNSVDDSVTITVTPEQPPVDPPVTPPTVTECNDGLDNDGDGKIDHSSVTPLGKTSDPGCKSPDDPSELDDPDIREI